MVSNRAFAPRGSAAAAAAAKRRRRAGEGSTESATKMLQFYSDEPGLKLSANTVLIMSAGFILVVVLLHVFNKLFQNGN